VSRTIVVSNRGPLTFRAAQDGDLVPVPAAGGLASSLYRLLAGSDTTWASVTMGTADREAVSKGLMHLEGLDLMPVLVDDETYRQAYDVVANSTLWYVHHHLFDLPNRPRFDRRWRQAWDGYRAYNRAMADAVSERAGDGDTVLVQDYHFSLLGRMLADRRPDLRTVHFLHTPFAEPAILAVLPDDVSAELLDGMAGYGACGFHCHKWEAGFLACYEAMGRGRGRGRGREPGGGVAAPRTFVAPLGLDVDGVTEEAATAGVAMAADALPAELGGRRVVARADRMEPSKNIVRGMLAFEELLVAQPEWRGQVVHLVCAYPSRQGLAEYLAYAADVEHTAERINHAFGTGAGAGGDGWSPIVLSVADDHARSLAALTLSDVLLLNPVRDGMNLVAKEGSLVNKVDGVLVLSQEAGAWEELELGGEGALGVNPFDVAGTADALHMALTMSPEARAGRAGALRTAVLGRTSADWWQDQLAAAQG
jgi:trehalose 6-phosphate synthase